MEANPGDAKVVMGESALQSNLWDLLILLQTFKYFGPVCGRHVGFVAIYAVASLLILKRKG